MTFYERYGGQALLLTICGLVLVLCFVLITKFSQPMVVNFNGKTLTEPTPFQGEMYDWQVLSHRFAENHEYNRTEYNCINYTRDLKEVADTLGFDVEMVYGYTIEDTNNSGHAWLKLTVDFEPQTGEFVDYSKKFPVQKIKEVGK